MNFRDFLNERIGYSVPVVFKTEELRDSAFEEVKDIPGVKKLNGKGVFAFSIQLDGKEESYSKHPAWEIITSNKYKGRVPK